MDSDSRTIANITKSLGYFSRAYLEFKICKGVWGDEDVLGHCKSLVEIQVLVCTEKERHL
jgi:hypothetical protein